jgi:hypothetical protein
VAAVSNIMGRLLHDWVAVGAYWVAASVGVFERITIQQSVLGTSGWICSIMPIYIGKVTYLSGYFVVKPSPRVVECLSIPVTRVTIRMYLGTVRRHGVGRSFGLPPLAIAPW